MFLNILRISASNVLKMFINIIVSIGCAVVISIRTNQPEAQIRFVEFRDHGATLRLVGGGWGRGAH